MKTTLAILILGTALSLSAQEARFGVQGALAIPTSDLSDNADAGLQVGGHAKWDFTHGHGIMARVDATFFGQNDGVDVTNLAVAADYTYHFERRQRGLYVLAGLSGQNYHSSYHGYSQNDNGLGLDLGVGYDLDRHVGLQARYTTTNVSNATYAALNLGVTYTF
ncbi:MAG: outer membrane beta-barrel protein [Holophaga sp.]|nr:outer membrane beta-barrel protein [Holophaga sp.]